MVEVISQAERFFVDWILFKDSEEYHKIVKYEGHGPAIIRGITDNLYNYLGAKVESEEIIFSDGSRIRITETDLIL